CQRPRNAPSGGKTGAGNGTPRFHRPGPARRGQRAHRPAAASATAGVGGPPPARPSPPAPPRPRSLSPPFARAPPRPRGAARAPPRAIWTGHTAPVRVLAFAPDGGKLASGSQDKTIRLWRVTDGRCLATLESPAAVRALAFSPDGQNLVSAGGSPALYVWDPV